MHRDREKSGKSRRQRKIEEQIKRILGDVLRVGANDPRIGFVSVLGVEATGDLKNARVYVSVLGEDEDTPRTMEGLESARSFFQRELGRRMSSRYTPVISFHLDDSIEYSNRIDRILTKIKEDESEDSSPSN
ncbi:MAG: 30S ribosome-binding factor RbfA [Candidatus Auribacterota bacterium]|nr:30S ribosome-binding factor RbfA [Candidatus Auribacterota bacterium]